jgi:hypothetical protein
MNRNKYYLIVAYMMLGASTIAFLGNLIIMIIMLIDVIFGVGFGYPIWSIFAEMLIIALTLMMGTGAVFFLRKLRAGQH